MKLLNRKGHFYKDWSVKMLCLVCAIVLYFMIGYVSYVQRVVEIPLEIKMPVGYSAQNILSTSTKLKIEGDNTLVYMVAPNEIKAVCDFSKVSNYILDRSILEGVPLEAKINLDYDTGIIKVGKGLTLAVEPDSVKILFEKDN